MKKIEIFKLNYHIPPSSLHGLVEFSPGTPDFLPPEDVSFVPGEFLPVVKLFSQLDDSFPPPELFLSSEEAALNIDGVSSTTALHWESWSSVPR